MITYPEFSLTPRGEKRIGEQRVMLFGTGGDHRDERTITSFGEEWGKFNAFDEAEIERAGNEYFDIVANGLLGPDVVALDMGCGSGRWTSFLSSRVGHIEAVDPSDAIFHAAGAHGELTNVRWTQAGVDNIPFTDGTFDLVICLGVLHHVPDTAGALQKLVSKVKPGGHVLLYLYYSLDGRGIVYRSLFELSNVLRRLISSMPSAVKKVVCDAIAYSVYVPLSRFARVVRSSGVAWWERLPLSHYHDKSMTILRNDALDRFGTPLEQRFSRKEMEEMMRKAGLQNITFSSRSPYWHAIGQRP